MMKRKLGRTPSVDRDVSGMATQYLISYLQDFEPAGTLQKVFREAGETRSAKTLQTASTWSSYAQYRRLLEATGSVLNGLDTLAHVSDHVFDSHQSPELSGSMSSLGSPADTYAVLPELMKTTVPIVELITETVSPTECRIRVRLKDGFEPFPEYCAYQINLFGTLPRLFGAPEAEVFIEACQCEGADYCQALLRWSPIDDVAARVSHAEIKAQLSESRLKGLQRTLADLVSGDDLQIVLARVVEELATAVPALRYVIDIDPGVSRDRLICSVGIDEAESIRTADELCHGATNGATGETGETKTPRHIDITPVTSDKKRYGTLISIRPEGASFQPDERLILESYARLAASALDSASAILEARQQTTSAQALLTLSASLSELASTEEMVERVARAIPSVVTCDRVIVWLIEPGESIGRVAATFGFDRAAEAAWHALVVTVPSPNVVPLLAFHHVLVPGHTEFTDLLIASHSMAAVSFPIVYDSEPYGWITVDVTNHPERLDDDIDVTERLRALAGQAAVAIRNGRLLGEIRHRALHDSLTGLPNRVLVLDRISQTLSRARREHTAVAVLFIDLDGLKDVNDTLGHAMGDRLLQAVAARFSGTLREADTVARLGGDEFVVLADGLSGGRSRTGGRTAARCPQRALQPRGKRPDAHQHLGQHRHRVRPTRTRPKSSCATPMSPCMPPRVRARTATPSSRPRCTASAGGATSSRPICRRPSAPSSSSSPTSRSSISPRWPSSGSKRSCVGSTRSAGCSSPTSSSRRSRPPA